jgi:hypothetical protein
MERTGFLTHDLEEMFWRSFHPTQSLLRYDDHARRGSAWNRCWNNAPKPADICFNVDAGTVLIVPSDNARARYLIPPVDEPSLMMQSDLMQLGLYQPPRKPRDPPVVVAIQRLGGSRTFLNFTNMLAQLSRAMPRAATMTVYWGNESLRETARMFGSASIVFG